jgi:hypothetical protein
MRAAIHSLLVSSLVMTTAGYANAQSQDLQIEYRSAFENYSTWKPKEGDRDWVGANQNVEKIGGWQYYAREPYLTQDNAQPKQEGGMGHDMSKMKKPMNPGAVHEGGH